MTSTAGATTSPSTRTERYRAAERKLWQHYGLNPHERFLELESPAARLRVLELACRGSTTRPWSPKRSVVS